MALPEALRRYLDDLDSRIAADRTDNDYINRLPLLDRDEFPDSTEIDNRLIMRVGELLSKNGFTKGQRASVTRAVYRFWRISVPGMGDFCPNFGHLREMTDRQLSLLSASPTDVAIRIIRKLVGGPPQPVRDSWGFEVRENN